MNAVDEIQTAIDGLTALLKEANSGPWGHERGSHEVTAEFRFVGFDIYPYDAELIVTLHRTIDAQLAILGTARLRLRTVFRSWDRPYPDVIANTLDLARAINGTT